MKKVTNLEHVRLIPCNSKYTGVIYSDGSIDWYCSWLSIEEIKFDGELAKPSIAKLNRLNAEYAKLNNTTNKLSYRRQQFDI